MKLLFMADIHIQPRAPISRRDDFASTALRKMKWVFELSQSLQVDAIVNLGDLFHYKDPNRTPYWLLSQVYTKMTYREWKCDLYTICGNHDLQSSGVQSLSRQPIGLLIQAGALLHSTEIFLKGWHISFVDHQPRILETFASAVPKPRVDMHNLLCAHIPVTPDGSPDSFSYQQLAMLGYDVVIYGHMHVNVAPTLVGNTIIAAPGALTRGTISAVDLASQPSVLYLDTDTELRLISVPCEEPDKVFKFDEHHRKRYNEGTLKAFVSIVRDATLKGVSLQQALDSARFTVPAIVYDTAVEYIERVK